MRFTPLRFFALFAVAPLAHGAITIGSNSTEWDPFTGNYDFLSDQQTGQPSADIVGSGTNYGFFMAFDDNGASFSTDGNLAFRIRFDEPGDGKNPANFKGVVWVGIDADLSGTIDVFLGLSDSGNSTEIVIRDAGGGLNNSPSTTTISNADYWITTADSTNYNYRAVNYLNDGGTTNDIITNTPLTDPDYYVSFMVPFQQVVNFLNTQSINVTDQTEMRYMVATSTQTNSLNQDLGGVDDKNDDLTQTWVQLGGFTETVALVPEPSSGILALGSMLGCLWIRRRR